MARPTHLTQDIIDQASDYIETYETTYKQVIPSVVGLCGAINRSRSTVYQWADVEGSQFADILDKINEKQQEVLILKGLTSEFNSAITKLVLGKHGYHDKQETELTGKDGGPVSVMVSFVNAPG